METALALFAVGVGALVQGSVGFGFSLVAVPIIALFRPEALPTTVLLLALPMTAFITLRERHSIDVAGFVWITGGRFLGTIAGVGLLVLVPENLLARFLGLLIVVAALISFLSPDFEARSGTQLAGGIASGTMGTAAALGGPPLALVNQKRCGPQLRSTLGISFLLGALMSLVALALAGRVEQEQAFLALQLLPGLVLGLWISRWVARSLKERWLRPVVLTFAAAAGLVVVVLGSQG